MLNVYAKVREELANLLRNSVYAKANDADFTCCAHGFEVKTALPLLLNEDPEAWLEKIDAKAQRSAPWLIGNMEARGGHICFSLKTEAYERFMKEMMEPFTVLPCLFSIETREAYAYMRMRMLSQKAFDGCADDESVKHALWLAFGLCENKSAGWLKEACGAALSIGCRLPVRERMALKNRCGAVGYCIARLMEGRMAN